MRLKISLLLFAFVALCAFTTHAQKSKAQLEKERKENLKRISETQKILEQTATEKKSTLGQLKAINHQITIRQDLIKSINQEISMINGEINDLTIVTVALESDLDQLKKEYAEMIYSAYKTNHGYSQLTFIFSASTFNQLFLRLKYLEQYANARERQVQQIEKVKDALNSQKSSLVSKKEEQSKLLESKIEENKNLIGLQSKQSKIIQDLSKREKELKRELANRKRSIEQLDQLLAEIIKKEIRDSNKGKEANTIALSAEGAVLSASFEDNKNKLPWPVASGFVSEKFGKHPHPVLKNITVENQGVDIQTQKDASVKPVFAGKVATTAFVPGMNSVVIVQHGDYYTLYAKLKTVNVKKGQTISPNQSLGTVYTNKDGISELQFQVWKNNVKLDPEKWLSSK
ncbi:murein hydrolase activator EnvC family protein [Reichenbachiella ulvae]|uniref:Peptidoglycan DD-metalloendopeptidase family protein n=1 Tax=Reichenbachiella ulvae TaxID=2980104 RepID=A0ABT3CWV5_9BACT|nr:peptidoglycan DD-metalloendopeptidase family protein [Reichenbachiella ulvae]MCV9388014.1 peptidoglycan DD-metalloendopeptidase family protein [Reichenbachiella ulvae]